MRRALPLALALSGCFAASAPQRSYFVLHGRLDAGPARRPIDGLVRVRSLDTDKAYDKFQIVVRRNPYELRYSESNVWAVKPGRMLADLLAQGLTDREVFGAVARELGETRPKYTLSGLLEAIEIYDSGDDLWFAHLRYSLRLTRFSSGEVLWTRTFDDRREVHTRTFSHAVRTLSELFVESMTAAILDLDRLRPGSSVAPPTRTSTGAAPPVDPKVPIFVPERR